MENIQFGEVSLDQLLDAQKVTVKVLSYIKENKDCADEEIRNNVRIAMMAVALNDLMTGPIINLLVKEIGESIEAEMRGKDKETHISIKVPVSREKS